MSGERSTDQSKNGIYSTVYRTSGIKFIIKRDLKKTKIQELIKNIPNSINNNKEMEVATIKQIKPRYNVKKLLTGKILTRITNTNDIPLYYIDYLVHTLL